MNVQDIFEVVILHVREVLPELTSHDFKFTDSLRELGANSIDRSEIIAMTLDSLSLNIPLVEVARAQNIGELAGILHQKFSPSDRRHYRVASTMAGSLEAD